MGTDLVFLRADRVFASATLVFATAVPILAVGRYIDTRQLNGDGVWSKPLRFALALFVHFGTFMVIAHWLPRVVKERTWFQLMAVISVAAAIFELSYISVQAARARHSHFNDSTPTEATMSALMGLGAFLVLIPGLAIGLEVAARTLPSWTVPVRVGVAVGLLGGTTLTALTGLRMGAARSHLVGRPPATSRRMSLTGWSLDGADLRPSHFLAAHMMQGVPLAAASASLLLPSWAALIATALSGFGWLLLTLWAAPRAQRATASR